MPTTVKQAPKAAPKGKFVQNFQPPPEARTLEGEYRDRGEEAAAVKANAKLLIADMLRKGEIELDLDADEKMQAETARNVARKMQVDNAPKGMRPSSAPGQKPVRKPITQAERQVIPNYNQAFDFALNPQNQNYCLFSTMGPRNCTPRNDEYAFRIWGVFPTKESATDYCEYIRRNNRYAKFYDIILLEMGANAPWAAFPPKTDEIEQQEFQNKHVQDFHDARLEAQRKASEHHAMRMEKAEDINPELARQRKIRKTDKKFKDALALRAAKAGVTVEELLEHAGDDLFALRKASEKAAEAEIQQSQMPQKPEVTFEQRVDEDGNLVTVKKTRTLVKKQQK
jgi:hypothetical protein